MKIHLRSFHFAAMLLLFAGIISAAKRFPFQSPLTKPERLRPMDSPGYRWQHRRRESHMVPREHRLRRHMRHILHRCIDIQTNRQPTRKPRNHPHGLSTICSQFPVLHRILHGRTPGRISQHHSHHRRRCHPVADLLIRNYYYGGKQSVMLPEITESGDYYITLRHYSSGPEGMLIGIKDFVVDVLKDGSAEGKVTTYIDGTSPCGRSQNNIHGPNTYTAVTDAEGFYRFEALPAADYVVTYTKFGFEEDSYPRTVTVNASETLIHNISIFEMWKNGTQRPRNRLCGNPLPGARQARRICRLFGNDRRRRQLHHFRCISLQRATTAAPTTDDHRQKRFHYG